MGKSRRFVVIGETYGDIEVLSLADRAYKAYECRCKKCGSEFVGQGVAVFEWEKNGCPRCSDRRRKEEADRECRSYVGKVYGSLEVVEYLGKKRLSGNMQTVMLCRCLQCQGLSEIPLTRLKRGGASKCKACNMLSLKKGREITKELTVGGTVVSAIDGKRKLNKNNSSGYKGVSYNEKEKKYRAYIFFKRKQYHLGEYAKLEDAVQARKEAEKKIFGGFLEWYKSEYPDRWERIYGSKE